MRYERTFEIEAPAARAWEVVADVERWPEWTASIQSLRLLDGGKLGPGARGRVKQPGVPGVVWTVTNFEAGRSFTWQASNPGMKSTGYHSVEPEGEGRCRVTLAVEQTGPFTWLAGFWLRRVTKRFVDMEAAGLKRRVEGATGAEGASRSP